MKNDYGIPVSYKGGVFVKIKLMVIGIFLGMFGSVALAQIDPGPDGIGIYADMEAMANSAVAGEGILELYLLVTGHEADGIGAWEMRLNYDGPINHIGHLIPYNSINVGQWPDYIVGVVEFIPPAPVMHLMTLTFMVVGTEPASIYVEPASVPVGGSLGNNLPVYVNGLVHEDLRNLYPSSGSIDLPVFRLNGEAPVATDPVSWDRVKAMYR
jgi:hypothetical protein